MTAVTKAAASAARRRKPGASYHHGDLRRALVSAGLELLEKHGVGGLSLRQVAQAAGVSPAAPYAHFPDKMALLAAIAAEGFVSFKVALEGGQAKTPQTRLEAMALAYILFARRNPALFRLMFGAELADLSPYPDLREKAVASFAVLQNAIAATKGQEADREGAMTAAWSFVHGLAVLMLDGRIAQGANEQEAIRRIKAATRRISIGLHH